MNKIPVAVLGATGSVGQKFVELLHAHPWFEITALCASQRSVGKSYREATSWFQSTPLPESISSMVVRDCQPNVNARIVFSGLNSDVAGPIETSFAKAGFVVVSNSRNHRMDYSVPLLIPEINSNHLNLLDTLNTQSAKSGYIVTNPNCSTIGLCLALKPIVDAFGVREVSVVTMQALSGAGYPGVSSLDIVDNVVPYIAGEEEKMQTEPLKVFGDLINGQVESAVMNISATCNRVAVLDGHTECVSVSLDRQADRNAIVNAWRTFTAEPQMLDLPSAPAHPIHYFEQDAFPQPRKQRMVERGMAVCVGRLRTCSIMDWKFTILSHNTIRGAAGGAILNAELLVKKGYV